MSRSAIFRTVVVVTDQDADETMQEEPNFDAKLEAERDNGIILLSIEATHDGYLVNSLDDYALVECIRINGNYTGADEMEIECDDYEIRDAALELYVDEPEYRP